MLRLDLERLDGQPVSHALTGCKMSNRFSLHSTWPLCVARSVINEEGRLYIMPPSSAMHASVGLRRWALPERRCWYICSWTLRGQVRQERQVQHPTFKLNVTH
ncbi:hypothetical protein BDN67DRAFT_518441 [Paxillus ammoniavirescens]|nr:hypothetical protein BDN67DRAFT_518441 [Paxillus ammoniavirescens]